MKKESEEGDEPRAETESESEEELSCFAPTVQSRTRKPNLLYIEHRCNPVVFVAQVDVKTTALAMAITDSELSDEEASILESGGFSVSRATTPQLTDLYEGKGSLNQCPTAAPQSSQRSCYITQSYLFPLESWLFLTNPSLLLPLYLRKLHDEYHQCSSLYD